MHSETYLTRNNNPEGRFKSFEHHREHFKTRLKERFEIDLTDEEYGELIKNISKDGVELYKLNSGNAVYSLNIKGKLVWVLYGKKQDILPARLKTAMIPYKYLVPDCVSHLFNHDKFTNELNFLIIEIKKISEELNLEDKKSFFQRTDLTGLIKRAVLSYKEFGDEYSIHVIKPAIQFLKERYSNVLKK